jgi:hypothetical protein
MSGTSLPSYPECHMGQILRTGRDGTRISTPVWICEYPYRTLRTEGPSDDCSDCPVWHQLQRKRRRTDLAHVDEVERLEHQLSC